MKSISHLLQVLFSMVPLVFSLNSHCQNETTTFGFGYNFIEKKGTIDLLFNRKASTKAKEAFDISLIKNAFVLNPTSEIHLGPGTANSENNVILSLNTFFRGDITKFKSTNWTWLYKINLLSPQYASDKNFEVQQAFLTLGGDLIPYYSKRTGAGYVEGGFGLDYDYGWSKIETIGGTENISRIKVRPFFQYQFWGKVSDPSFNGQEENDPDFYYKMDLTFRFIHYSFFHQDERVTSDKSIGYFNASFGYRFVKNLKLTLEFKDGRMEPKYTDVNSFSLGLTLVK